MKKKSTNPQAPGAKRFATHIGVLVATLGSAVGLGNIWKFPSLAGANGGAAFMFIYLICTLVIGLPVLLAELSIGREGRGDSVRSFQRVAPGTPWWLIGAAGVLAAFLIMSFYAEVAGWVLAYFVKAIGGGALSTEPAVTLQAFQDLVSNPVLSLLVMVVVLAITGTIIMLGVSKGIEATTKRLMPLLLLMLVIVGVRSLTLPGGGAGLEFLFKPDWSKVTFSTVLTALGLAFFKLSLGMGCMMTYAAYYPDDEDIPKTATRVVFSDLTISILAGIAIFPAVFAFGFEPQAGVGLLFITIPAVFASMPFGGFFMALFFLLTFFAASGAIFSLLEVIVSFLENQFGFGRVKATLVTILGLTLFGAPAALSNSLTADLKVFGKNFFDLYDFVSSNLLLPIGGIFISLFVAWVWKREKFQEVLSNRGSLNNLGMTGVIFALLKYVTPFLILVVLVSGLL
jgi:NSS family neurotransmitter:Na+ symporter